MEILYDLVPPAELTQYIRAWDLEINQPNSDFVLNQILPDQFTDDLEFQIRKGSLPDVDAATFRAFDTPAKHGRRQGTRKISGSLGPVSKMMTLGEEETLRKAALDRGTNDPIINQIYADAENMCRAVKARAELARGDLIDDGIININEGGLFLEADFGRSAEMSETAPAGWDNPATTILTQLLGYCETYYDLNGFMPPRMRITRQHLRYMQLNDEIRDHVAPTLHGTPVRINREDIQGVFTDNELPQLWVYDGKVRVNGTQVDVLPSNKVYLMPGADEPLGNTFYGTTAEALKLREKGLITREESPGIVAVALTQDHPVSTATLATALIMPAMPNPDLIMDIDVDA